MAKRATGRKAGAKMAGAKQSGRQKEIVGRVMHEYKHGELETAGRRVKNPRQAVAIALSEAGSSNRQSTAQNRKRRAKSEAKERAGKTARQQKEGTRKAAPPKRAGRLTKTTKATKQATRRKETRPRKAAIDRRGPTRAALYAEVKRRGLTGCSRMSKAELARVLRK